MWFVFPTRSPGSPSHNIEWLRLFLAAARFVSTYNYVACKPLLTIESCARIKRCGLFCLYYAVSVYLMRGKCRRCKKWGRERQRGHVSWIHRSFFRYSLALLIIFHLELTNLVIGVRGFWNYSTEYVSRYFSRYFTCVVCDTLIWFVFSVLMRLSFLRDFWQNQTLPAAQIWHRML